MKILFLSLEFYSLKIKTMKTLNLTFVFILFCQIIFGQVNIIPARTDVAGYSTWIDTDVAGTTYLQLLKSTSSTVTPSIDFSKYINKTLNFKARTYGGSTVSEVTITVSISTDNGLTWNILGTRTPTNSTLTAQTKFDLEPFNGKMILIKFSVAGTSNSIGAGIDDINITGILQNCITPSVQANNITFNNIGLDKVTINWSKADGEFNAVYVNSINSFINPIDSIEGVANTQYTNGQILVYSGSGSSVNVTGLNQNSEYFTCIYSYNCSGEFTKYLILNPVINSFTTSQFCTNATTQSSNIVAIPNSNYITLNWIKGDADYRIVLAKEAASITSVPLNGISYSANYNFGAGSQIGSGEFVVYNGNGNSVNVTNLKPETKYYFTIFEYCKSFDDSSIGYLTSTVSPEISSTTIAEYPSTCFEIESILVDACADQNNGYNEGPNEMLRFKVGLTELNAYKLNMLNLGNNIWQGIVQDSSTASITAELNKTIKSNCGILIEPINGILPPKSNVLLITSSDTIFEGDLFFDLKNNSFANLTDTLYVIYQKCSPYIWGGHFTNTGTLKNYEVTVSFSEPTNCSDVVVYDRSKFTINDLGFYDGGRVNYDWNNTAHYINYGCNPLFEPLIIDISDISKTDYCVSEPINLIAKVQNVSNEIISTVWTGGNGGTFEIINDTLTQYNPIIDEIGSETFIFSVFSSSCGSLFSSEINILYSNCLGINETKNSNFSIFPNPTTGILNIKFENIENETQIKILDISGREIISNLISTKETQIDLSNVSKGIYFVKLQNEKFSETQKVVIK